MRYNTSLRRSQPGAGRTTRRQARQGEWRWRPNCRRNRRSWPSSFAPVRRTGHQCFGSYFDEKGGSCALGAVYEGVYHLPRHHGKLVPDHLERLFRCLDEVVKKCPQGCNKRLPLAPMIVHLNDDHRMTREQIAEWLAQEANS